MHEEERVKLAVAAGRGWAEHKAESLRDIVPAVDWPDLWADSDDRALPFSSDELDPGERHSLGLYASHAAHERWRELVVEQRALESAEEEEHDVEAEAASLEAMLRDNLPAGVGVGRDGPRVYIWDEASGMERTITSLETAWRAVDQWREKRTPGV